MTSPITLHVSEDKIQSGFEVGTNTSAPVLEGVVAMGNGTLGDFVDDSARRVVGGARGTGGNDGTSRGNVKPREKNVQTSPSRLSKDTIIDQKVDRKNEVDRKKEVIGTPNDDSPIEPGYLEDYDYNVGGFFKTEEGKVQTTPPPATEEEDVVKQHHLQTPLEDTLGPWKSERVKPATASDELEGEGDLLLDEGQRDSGVATASELNKELSDEEGTGFGQPRREKRRGGKRNEEVGTAFGQQRGRDGKDKWRNEEGGTSIGQQKRTGGKDRWADEEGGVLQQRRESAGNERWRDREEGYEGRMKSKRRSGHGGESGVTISDEDSSKSPYDDYGYGKPGTYTLYELGPRTALHVGCGQLCSEHSE